MIAGEKTNNSPFKSPQASKDLRYSKENNISEESPFKKGITLHKLPKEFTNYEEEEEQKGLETKHSEKNPNANNHDMTGLFDRRVVSNELTNFDFNGAKSVTHKKSSSINNTKILEKRLMRSVHY